MQYWEILIETLSLGIEKLAAALTAAGFDDLVIEDQQEFESFLEENRAYWDYIDEDLQVKLQGLSQIKLYISTEEEDRLTALKTLVEELKAQKDESLGTLKLTVNTLAPTDWEESWKDNYPPQPVGEKLMVLPYWLDDSQGRIPVILDPGLTFGTGAHPSTQMVMEFMEEADLAGKTCLDLGSGSGILSITALRLGAKQAVGVDIDPKAEDIARENAAYNGFSASCFTALTGNVTADHKLMRRLAAEQYDLVLVNIVADVIIGLMPILPNFVGQSTTLLLSGILDSREQDVLQALQQANFTVVGRKACEDWRCLKVRKLP